MPERLDRAQLYRLRNAIPIRWLITVKLGIPNKTSENIFRFECPCCRGFHTGTNPNTNLARCFDCRRNFNPIDLVMESRSVGFLESVAFLQGIRHKPLASERELPSKTHRPAGDLVLVRDILRRIASKTGVRG